MQRLLLLWLLLTSFLLSAVTNEVLLQEIRSTNKRLDIVHQNLNILRENMNKRFEQVDKRFDQVDKRFEQVDKMIEQIRNQLDFTNNILYGIAIFVSSIFFIGLFLQDRHTKRFENFIISHEESHKEYIKRVYQWQRSRV